MEKLKNAISDRAQDNRAPPQQHLPSTSPAGAELQLRAVNRDAMGAVRALADQAFSRAAGAPLVEGNRIRLLKDADENYPAWLDAIRAAQRHIHFENYIIYDDEVGRMFADALIAKAREGVRVRLIYDWLGGFGKASRRFWKRLRSEGVEVRCYNPPRWHSPFDWPNRDHRKMVAVDAEVGFVTGLCVGTMWAGDPKRNIEPWRDTGVEVRGPSVADIEFAFADVWAMLGEPIPEEELPQRESIPLQGNASLRIVANVPATAGLLRMDQLIAALARNRLWLTDAYYGGTTAYAQALRAAAQDGADVRLLVPNASDLPLLKPLSRAGYRPLLEAGVRVFEWNGAMLHAKTAVADGRWARVGSSNLNIASWFGNCELDVVAEDETFAGEMEQMYLEDLENATEVVLDARRKLQIPRRPRHSRRALPRGRGSGGRAAAGAVRIGNAVGAAFKDRRELGAVEARLAATTGAALLGLAVLFAVAPKLLAYPLALICAWIGGSLLYSGYKWRRRKPRRKPGGKPASEAPVEILPSDSTLAEAPPTRP
jgi:cardiolipin synthase